MAINLGATKKPAVAGPVPSMEELFDAYLSFESVSQATEVFINKGSQLEDALENLCIVGKTLKMHASEEGLAVVKSIVRDELGAEVSLETIKDRAKEVLQTIWDYIKKIGNWIAEYFARILNWATRADKRLNAAIAAVKKMKDGAHLEWSYKGINLMTAPSFTNVKSVADGQAAVYKDSDDPDSTLAKKNAEHQSNLKTRVVKGKEQTLTVLQNAKTWAALMPKVKKQMEAQYTSARNAVSKAGKNADVEALKKTQAALKAAVSATNKSCGIFARTLASVVAHAPMKSED